jgi:hypothetical protein
MAAKSLNLERLGKNASKKDYQDRINLLNAKIESGKLSAVMRKRATDYRWMAEQKLESLKNVSVKKTKKIKGVKNFNTNQLNLPGFLKTLDLVRIEELIANKIVEKVQNKTKKSAKKSTRKAA